jgi:hypothetical protein
MGWTAQLLVADLHRDRARYPSVPDPFYQRFGDAVQMKVNSKTTNPAARNSPWLGIVKFLFLVILIAIIFLLGQDMVRHRFFQGGWVSQHDVLKP